MTNFGCCALIGCLAFLEPLTSPIFGFPTKVSLSRLLWVLEVYNVSQPLKGTIGCKSFGGVRFDLGPFLQGKAMAAQHKSAYKSTYISLIISCRGLQ